MDRSPGSIGDMMLAHEHTTVEEVMRSVEAGRQRLADVDPIGATRAALSSARDVIPQGWPGRREHRKRWPWVAAIIVGTTVLGVVLLSPVFRRYMALARASRRRRNLADPMTAEWMAPADETEILPHPALPDTFGAPSRETDAE
jgi:hypothetical protein